MFKFLLERRGEQDDDQVGGGVEGDGDCAKCYELQEDVTRWRRNELRDEREEEERGLGVERFGEDALAEGVSRRWVAALTAGSALRVRIIRMPSQTR